MSPTSPILVLVLLLAAVLFSPRLAAFLRLPHAVFLVVLGAAAGLALRLGGSALLQPVVALFPDVLLYLLLPPLVFDSAYHLDARLLRRDLLPVAALATGALFASVLLIGFGLHGVFGWPLVPCLTFGALISATDPVAVVALFRELGAPRRLATLVEGESLANDGTALVLFRLLLALAAAQLAPAEAVEQAVLSFVGVCCGGLLVGFVVAHAARLLLRRAPPAAPAWLLGTVAAAYASYLVAELGLHVSGVLATLVTGLVLGAAARRELAGSTRLAVERIWAGLALGANTLVFLMVGLSADPSLLVAAGPDVPVTIVLAYAARALSVGAVTALVNRGRKEPVPFSYQVVLAWGGLRGGLALALASQLPPGFPRRGEFLALTLAVVLATLLVNATTTKALLRRLLP